MTEFLKKNKDKIICISLILLFFIIAVTNLGSTKAPETTWAGSESDILRIKLEEKQYVSKVVLLNGIGEGTIEISEKDQILGTITQDYANVLSWQALDLPVYTEYIYLTFTGDVKIKEIGFLNIDNEFVTIQEVMNETNRESVKELYDEQDKLIEIPSYYNSTYFDEVYYARSSEEFFDNGYIFETTHPPMAKNIIFLGARIFGNNPFGWRVMGVNFASIMVGLMYYLAKSIFKKTKYGVIAALILVFDFLHFSMSRICTIDTYVAFFILASYFTTYKYYETEIVLDNVKSRRKILYIILTGIFIGLTISSKWNGAFGLVGIAIIFIYILVKKYLKNRDVKNLFKYIGIYAIFLVIVPIAIYLMAYLPLFIARGESYNLSYVLQEQVGMYKYHSLQRDSHPYQSSWWQWLYDYKPLFAASNSLGNGENSLIYFFMSPSIMLGNSLSIIFLIAYIIIQRIKKKKIDNSKGIIYILLGAITTILPWTLVERSTYIYHFYPTLLFTILLITYVISIIEKNKKLKWVGITFVILVITSFIFFFPVISGLSFGKDYSELMQMFSEWFWMP